jgi:hypothetical protein
MLAKIKALLTKLGITIEGKTDDDILKMAKEAGIDDTAVQTQSPPAASNATPSHNGGMIDSLKQIIEQQNAKIDSLTTIIGEMKGRSDKAEAAFAEDAKQKRTAEIAKILDDAIKSGRIPADNAEQKQKWQKLFSDGFDAAKLALEQIPANKSVAVAQNDTKSQSFVAPSGALALTPAGKIAQYVNAGLQQ